VCAPEVKKKFQNCETKMRCTTEKYFAGELHNKRGLSNAQKKHAVCCGTDVSPAFLHCVEIGKIAGETPAPRKTCALI
jgi:hypothetical protein